MHFLPTNERPDVDAPSGWIIAGQVIQRGGVGYRGVDIGSWRQLITVRPLRPDEGRTYLEIVNRAIRGHAVSH